MQHQRQLATSPRPTTILTQYVHGFLLLVCDMLSNSIDSLLAFHYAAFGDVFDVRGPSDIFQGCIGGLL